MNDNVTIQWRGNVSQTRNAVSASGGIEGGGRVLLDVPELYVEALAQLLAVRGCELEITVRVVAA